MKKPEYCPRCEEDNLHKVSARDRLEEWECYECGWRSEPFIPEILEIKDTKEVVVNQFGGYEYWLYDGYGHVCVYSRTYYTEEEAIKEATKEVKQNNKFKGGPYTAIVWPKTVTAKGKIIKD